MYTIPQEIMNITDLKDNLDCSRLPELTEADLERIKKYNNAFNYLLGTLK